MSNAPASISIPPCDRPSAARIFWTSVFLDESLAGALFIAIVGTIVLSLSALALKYEAAFHYDGVQAPGKVTGKRIAVVGRPSPMIASVLAHGGGDGPRHVVDYEFVDAAGATHTARANLAVEKWNQTNIGDPVQVTYVRSDPGTSRISDENGPPVSLMIILAGVGCVALYGSLRMWITGASRVRRNLDLFQTGEPVLARVVEVIVRKGRKGRVDRTLQYSYQAPESLSGRMESFNGACPGAGRRGKSAERGDALLVCYDERDPQRHAVDRYGLFDLATWPESRGRSALL